MRALGVVLVALACGCSKAPAGVRLEESVACGKAIDVLDGAQAHSPSIAAAEFTLMVSACLGTLVDPACKALASKEPAPEAMKACLAAYCPALPAPKPTLCARPISNPLDAAMAATDLAIAAKQFDLRAFGAAQPYLAPYAPHLAAQAYSRQRWGCGRAAVVVRVRTDAVEFFDGPSLKPRPPGGCADACVAVATDVTLGRVKQVLSELSCSASTPVATFEPGEFP